MSKWYGNLTNRLEEGRQDKPISIGDDITMYLWSDRKCYYVCEVMNQKKIKVRPYYVCADHSKEGGAGHQNWMYFKLWDNYNKYLSGFFPEHFNPEDHRDEPEPQIWVFRYGKWMQEYRHEEMEHPEFYSKREQDHFAKHGWYNTYHDLSGKVSFGVRDYYYDWEF